MKVLKLLALVAVVGLAIHWWRDRGVSIDGGARSANGFVSIIAPEGAATNTVLIFAPLNCRSDVAQRADALALELNSRRIPNVRSDSYRVPATTSGVDLEGRARRTTEVMKAEPPIVVINGRAKANPTLTEVIAEYGGSAQQAVP